MSGPRMSDEVAAKLIEAANALSDVCQLWDTQEQALFDTSATRIRQAFGMSMDEVAAEILAFVAEGEAADIALCSYCFESGHITAACPEAPVETCSVCGRRFHASSNPDSRLSGMCRDCEYA